MQLLYSATEIQKEPSLPFVFLKYLGLYNVPIDSKFLLGYPIAPMQQLLFMFGNHFLEGSLRCWIFPETVSKPLTIQI